MTNPLDNINIEKCEPLQSPRELKEKYILAKENEQRILHNRQSIQRILEHKSDKFIVIVGPCSIHSPEEALNYAEKLKELHDKVSDKLMLIMRVYFEKPRTTVGWKGFIYDPDLDESYNIKKGIELARKLLLDIDRKGLPTATEILDPVTSQYIADIVSWAAIGARTTESQTHRQLASGLSMPIGFKNNTDGSITTAIDAIKAAIHTHSFLGVLEDSRTGVFQTKGNKYAHIVLRGGKNGPNYGSENITFTKELMKKNSLTPNIIIDCSHGNSEKKAENQSKVLDDIIYQKQQGEKSIRGVMLESNLNPGKQKITPENDLTAGVSITDPCIGWKETENLINKLYREL